ncbi:sphingosine-1-phosphate phosphatase 2 isoform X2 [Camponotus floridanus]|uniref:sphingosine-1-phosphate phosphatase 2 isoform X2 n=1 Tax=Camponotus floridanus TaxID=104421 RepID=UPI00059C1802|nr:sphingosine-1-phosphate phosphatase 2 isoform X2 [Camponotus floridanus]
MSKEETSTISENPHYTITNSFWYYLFLFGTELGDEIFYSSFIPFLFWNIDGAVGRRVVLVWAIVMTIGQVLKDIICWPRPACPPAVRLQNKWSQEYGMPSTHAMVGFAIPFSIVSFTMNKYIYPFFVGYFIALVWCILVSMSRLYLEVTLLWLCQSQQEFTWEHGLVIIMVY